MFEYVHAVPWQESWEFRCDRPTTLCDRQNGTCDPGTYRCNCSNGATGLQCQIPAGERLVRRTVRFVTRVFMSSHDLQRVSTLSRGCVSRVFGLQRASTLSRGCVSRVFGLQRVSTLSRGCVSRVFGLQ